MKLHYYPETDSLYIELKSSPGSETCEIISGVNVDLDEAGGMSRLMLKSGNRRCWPECYAAFAV
ncbi:MAG: DUF2283 domain-containing protein [Alphaproteobacteria bacterium]|nr:DUF2283 domain-containing protein [Alphaproteobacteria bacterium]